MTSEQTRPQHPLREGTSSEGGSELRSVEQMLTVQQREELRADLAEIARLRRRALDAFIGGAEGQDGSPLDIKLARAELGGRLSREHDVSGADFARCRAPGDSPQQRHR